MPEVDSIIYPLVVAVIITLGCLLVKAYFRRGIKINVNPGNELKAEYRDTIVFPLIFSILSLIGYIAFQYWTITNNMSNGFKPIFIVIGIIFFFQLFFGIFARTKKIKKEEDKEIVEKYNPIVLVPVYNEDVNSLKDTLNSLFNQTRLPKEIHVVDDGSKEKYDEVKKWFEKTAKDLEIKVTWSRHKKNQGKRNAHMTAFKNITKELIENAIIITVDSDGVVDKNAIEEGMIPFKDEEVYSVAGVIISRNANTNLLTRLADWIFVTQELIDRATMSMFGNVLVNSGALAFYRYEVLKIAEETGYTEEYFFNTKVEFSDDSYLTLIALKLGKTVHQPSAIVFADMPVSISHHIRQQIRWSRGSFIRSWWRLRYLDPMSYGWIRQVIGHVTFFTVMTVYIQLLVIKPLLTGFVMVWDICILGILLSYVQGIKYFAIKRNDSTVANQLLTYILSPLAILWAMLVLRTLKVYSYITCTKGGWGTRQQVEIVHENK